MADVIMPETIPCQFDAKGWVPCKKPTDNGWCTRHENLMCVSCGNKAFRSCDAGLSLLCGRPLCETCQHSNGDVRHITAEAMNEEIQARKIEQETRIASRTKVERRMNEALNIPLTLFELLKGGWGSEGYELKKVYYAELEHGLMGCFPAIFANERKRVVYTTDLNILKQVWRILQPRQSKIQSFTAYVNEELGVFYEDVPAPQNEDQEPEKLLNSAEFADLTENDNEAFRWAPGLVGGNSMSPENFLNEFVKQAKVLNPQFENLATT